MNLPLPHDESYRPSDAASDASWRDKPYREAYIDDPFDDGERDGIELEIPSNQTDDDGTDL